MPNEQCIWLIWSSAFLIPWLALYVLAPAHRGAMWKTSLFMMPFGLTEPLFVPEYWNPPSLFDLAQRTGFDIESLIFSFAIGGIGAVLYNLITRSQLRIIPNHQRHDPRHRLHKIALALPFVLFPFLYFLPVESDLCGDRSDDRWRSRHRIVQARPRTQCAHRGGLFLGIYTLFLLGLEWTAPGYIERAWNLAALSGILIYGLPIEAPLFGFSFGLFWAGLYEHFTWRRSVTTV